MPGQSNQLILIQGDISDAELKYLNSIYVGDDIRVAKYETKGAAIGGIEHGLQVIFQDFSIVGFIRDYIIAATIDKVLKSILQGLRKMLSYFKTKGKTVKKVITIIIKIQCEQEVVSLHFSIKIDRVELFFIWLTNLLTREFLNNLCSYSHVYFIQQEDNISFYGN
jgi:hypothetical protein